MKKIMIAGALAALALTAACRQSPQQNGWGQQAAYGGGDPCMQAQNPQECAQVRDAGGDPGQYLQYGMGGYMLGSMMTPYGQRSYLYPRPGYTGRVIPSYANSRSYVARRGYQPYSYVHRASPTIYPTSRVTTAQPQRRSIFGLGRSSSTPTYRSSPSYSSSGSSYRSSPSYSSRSYSSSYSSRSSSSRR